MEEPPIDPTEDKVRALLKVLDPQQIKDFIAVFPEFAQLNDSLELQELVAWVFLFAQKKIEQNDSPSVRIERLKKLCIKLLGEDVSPANSELFKWLNFAGKGRKGEENFGPFLGSFAKFLSARLKDILIQKPQLVQWVSIPDYKPLSFEEFKVLFPVFRESENAEEVSKPGKAKRIITPVERAEYRVELMKLINQFNSCGNKMAMRYRLMWIVTQVGTLAELILSNKWDVGDISDLEKLYSNKNSALTEFQQFRLFKTVRNLPADFFHLIYDDSMNTFLNLFSDLFNGRIVPAKLYAECIVLKDEYGAGRDLVKLAAGRPEVQSKMFAQMGYFLHKAREFFQGGEEYLPETGMALLVAGTCARFIITAKISDLPYESTPQLQGIRKILAHPQGVKYSKTALYAKIAEVIEKNIDLLIQACERDAKKVGLVVDVASYVQAEKPSGNSESPRMFKKH